MKYRLFLTCGIVGLFVISCTNQELYEKTFLIVDDAKNVHEYKTSDGERLQISYSVAVEYPNLAISESQWEKLGEKGWSKCEQKDKGWSTFIDASGVKKRTVFQNISYWAKGDQLLTISLNYYSALNDHDSPDNNDQHVLLLLDTHGQTGVVQERLGILCD